MTTVYLKKELFNVRLFKKKKRNQLFENIRLNVRLFKKRHNLYQCPFIKKKDINF